MKRLFIALMALSFCVGMNAQTDTEKKDKDKDEIIALNESKSVYIGDEGFISLGWNFGLNMPNDMDKANIHSIYFAWELADLNFKLGSDNDLFTVGFGMIWNKYSTSDNGFFYKKDGAVLAGKVDGVKSDYSRYLTYSLNIPLQYTHKAKSGVWFSVGPVVNFNLYGSIYNEIDVDNAKAPEANEYKWTTKGVYQNPVTVDLRLLAGYKDWGLMFKYSPMKVIESGKGPDFQSFGVGIVLKP